MILDEEIKRFNNNAEYERTHGNLQGCLDFRQLVEFLKELKQLREQTRWIPVSERLPEKEGLYLVSVKNDHERRYSKTCQYMGRNHWFARQDVEAWMPLPSSYQGE